MNNQNSKIMCSIIEHKSADQLQNDVQPTPITRKLREMVTNVPTDEHGNKMLREMVKNVPTDEHGNKLGRTMVEIVDNYTVPTSSVTEDVSDYTPRTRKVAKKIDNHTAPITNATDNANGYTPSITGGVDMCVLVDKKDVEKESVQKPNMATIASPITDNTKQIVFFGDDSPFKFENGVLFFEGIPFINCWIKLNGVITSDDKDYYRCQIYVKGQVFTKNVPISSEFSAGRWVQDTIGVTLLGDRNSATTLL